VIQKNTKTEEESKIANVSGAQPDIKYCSICKGNLENVLRSKMKSKGYIRKDGIVSEHTYTYDCLDCKNRFEINQDR
jgi:uncharacterized protein with PIN domain